MGVFNVHVFSRARPGFLMACARVLKAPYLYENLNDKRSTLGHASIDDGMCMCMVEDVARASSHGHP